MNISPMRNRDKSAVRHKNIPFFIPHAGCPHDCVFCSQEKITSVARCGESGIKDELMRLDALMKAHSLVADGSQTELAFFGGSFTAIEPQRLDALLAAGRKYIDSGIVSGIRISTRPDCIDRNMLEKLARAGVTDIELGIQSTDDAVLEAGGRGHTARDSENACALVREYGFSLVGQMMVGLPRSSLMSEIMTARDIVSFGCDGARIYPTVVFEGTALYRMTLDGEYAPLSNDEAADRCAACLDVFDANSVNVLKIGLHSSEELAHAPFGPNHPAMGELVEGRLYRSRAEKQLAGIDVRGKCLTLYVAPGCESKAAGHKRENRNYFLSKYLLSGFRVRACEGIARLEVKVGVEQNI